MEMGNERARKVYLSRLPRGYAEPSADADEERRRAFIRAKYVRMRWAEPLVREERLAARRAAVGDAAAKAKRAKRSPAARSGPMPSLSSEM